MSQTVGNGAMKRKALLLVTMTLLSSMSVLVVLLPCVSAAVDVVTIKDGAGNALTVVGNNTLANIQVTDGATLGGTKTVTVKEHGVANQITVTVYDNGAVSGDTAGDKVYLGTFNITNKGTGGTTNQATGVLAVPDAAQVDVTADLDAGGDSGTASVIADFTKPTCSITSKLNIYVSGNYYLSVTAQDTHMDKVSYQVDSGDILPTQPGANNKYTATIDTKNITEDLHEIEVSARDLAGNERIVTGNITVDRTAPLITIKPFVRYVSSNFFLNVTVNDTSLNASTVQYRLDAESPVTLTSMGNDVYTSTLDMSSENEGSHTVAIMATDLADNTENDQLSFTYDHTKAAITINNPTGQVCKDAFILNATVTDDNLAANEVKYKLDGNLPIMMVDKGQSFFEANIITLPLLEGAHSVVITEKDLAGNINTTAPFSFIVDKTAPNITINSPLSGYYRANYTLTAMINDANLDPLKVVYLTDGSGALLLPRVGSTNTFSKDLDVSNWNEKSYTLTVKATDKATNTQESNKVTVIVDRTPPSFTCSIKSTQTGYTFDVTINDAYLDVNSVYYTLDGSAKKDFDNVVSNKYTAIIPTANYPEGNHTFVVWATDKAGNVGNKTFTDSVVNPPAEVTGLAGVDKYDGTVLITWTASPATDLDHYNLYYRAYDIFTNISGMSPIATVKGATNYTLTGLAVGTRYYVAVSAVDTHGNELKDVFPTTVTSKESPKLPVISLTITPVGKLTNLKAGDSVTFNITVKDTGKYEADQLKIVLLDNDMAGDPVLIDLISPGSTTQRDLYWNADEGDHNLSVEAVLGVQVLAKTNVSATPIHVNAQKQVTTKTSWFNPYYILVIVGVIAGVGVLAFAWRTTKKQDKEIEQEEIELGLRPGKDGKIHKPENPNAPKPSGPAKPAHSPDVYIPSSPLLQQPPPAAPPAQPPQQQAYQPPPQQQYQQPPQQQYQQPPPPQQ